MHVQRRVDVVEADCVRPHPLEGGSRERLEEGHLCEIERMLREQERSRRKLADDLVAREDTRHLQFNVWRATNHQPVPASRIPGLHVVAPVGVGIAGIEPRRPVIVTNLRHMEVLIETRHEVVELHEQMRLIIAAQLRPLWLVPASLVRTRLCAKTLWQRH